MFVIKCESLKKIPTLIRWKELNENPPFLFKKIKIKSIEWKLFYKKKWNSNLYTFIIFFPPPPPPLQIKK